MSKNNILLITTDQQRFDTIAAAGNYAILTPHLDWLCDEGIRFERAYSDCPLCVPARATIMTGLHAWNHGLTRNREDIFPIANRTTLPGVLTQSGYQTRAVGKMHFSPARANYGFEHMEILADYYRWMEKIGGSPPLNHGVGQNEMQPVLSSCEEHHSITNWTVDRSIDFIETRDSTRPFFLWTSFSNPHPPFDPPESVWQIYQNIGMPAPWQGNWSDEDAGEAWRFHTWVLNGADRFTKDQWSLIRRAYYACITHIDYSLGRLFARLRELGHLDDTWIVFTSDHGEMLGDHGLAAKGQFLEGASHVPLLIRPPSSEQSNTRWDDKRGTTDSRLACLADILPTILDCAGVGSEGLNIDGLSLLEAHRRETLWGECCNYHAVITEDWKYQFCERGAGELLFELNNDPCELDNLSDCPEFSDRKTDLKAMLTEHLRGQQHPAVESGELRMLSQIPSAREVRAHSWRGLHSRHEPTDVLH